MIEADSNETTQPLGPVLYPGLTEDAELIGPLTESVLRHYSVLAYKEDMKCIWVGFIGGTGTGKSTLFNALIGQRLSAAGVERPKTRGPVAYAYGRCSLDDRFPFPRMRLSMLSPGSSTGLPLSGLEGRLQVFTHENEEMSDLVLLDTPDLDSVEEANRRVTEDLYLLSDAVVYVTSQEKYADEVPYRFLSDLVEQKKPYFFIMNKADQRSDLQEIYRFHKEKGIALDKNRIWSIPFLQPVNVETICSLQAFQRFRNSLLQAFSNRDIQPLRRRSLLALAVRLEGDATGLLGIGTREDRAAQQWIERLNQIRDLVCRDFVEEQKERFAKGRQESLGREIRRLFSRYDLLAGPRRFVKGIILMPLRMVGLTSPEKKQQEDLAKVRQKIDLIPVQEALARLNRLVFERLSPSDEASPLFQAMRRPGIILGQSEVESLVLKEEKNLEEWLKQTFDRLSREIPAGKRWGIYSTSIVWGILILSFETAVGGGFTVLDAAVDSALAPFVTKGAVELFAAREIRKIAGELSNRYREALLSVLRLQSSRYEDCIRSVMFPERARRELGKILDHVKARIASFKKGI